MNFFMVQQNFPFKNSEISLKLKVKSGIKLNFSFKLQDLTTFLNLFSQFN